MRVVGRVSLALLLAVVVLAGAAGPATASNDAPRSTADVNASQVEDQTEPHDTLNVTQEFQLAPERPGEVTVQLRYDVPSAVVSLRTSVPDDARVTDTHGFEHQSDRQYHWDESTSGPTITYALPVNQSLADDSPHNASGSMVSVDAGSWAMFQRPATNTRYDHSGPVAYESHVTTAGPGATGEWLVFLGDHDQYERSAHDQELRLVVPANANTTAAPETILDSLADAADSLRVGERNEEVFVVAAPTDGVAWGARGAHVGSSDVWVRDAEPVADPDNAWLHEYVHARQEYALDSEMVWFHEASASYYAALLTFEQGHIEYDRLRDRLAAGNSSEYDDVVLSNRSTWEEYPQYDRGALVAAEVDRQIRLASDGNRTLQSVFRAINERRDRTSLAVFRDQVRRDGNESVAAASERHVTAPTNVSTWNASDHRTAFGPFPPDVTYEFAAVDGSNSHLITGPYRTAVVSKDDPIVVVPGEQLYVDVEVANTGGASGEYNATLLVNGSLSDWDTGTVAGNETTTARVNHTFESTGRYELVTGDDRIDVFVTEPADVDIGPFRAVSETVPEGGSVQVIGSAANTAPIPANGSVTITRDGEPVLVETVQAGPDSLETIYATVPLESPGDAVLRFDGRHPVEVEVTESQAGVIGTDTPDSTPTATPAPTAAPPASNQSTATTATPGSGWTVPTSATGGTWFGSGSVVVAVLVAIGIVVRVRR